MNPLEFMIRQIFGWQAKQKFIETFPSPPDPRDHEHYDKEPKLKSVNWDTRIGFIENQKDKPRCVMQGIEVLERKKTNTERGVDCMTGAMMADFDAQVAYEIAKKIDGIPHLAGTYPKTGMKVWHKYGLIELHPQPGQIHTCNEYWRCKNFKEALNDLYTIGPITVCVRWYESFFYGDGVLIPKSKDVFTGLHQMALTRRTEKDDRDGCTAGINSYGSRWGKSGHFILPDKQWDNLVEECWCGQ